MSRTTIEGFRIAGVATCVPPRVVNNLDDLGFDPGEVRKVVAMAGVRERRVVDDGRDLGRPVLRGRRRSARTPRLGARFGHRPDLRDADAGLFLPSTSCMLHQWLGLSDQCAAFDVGLGCSGYPYGLYLAACMLRAGGHQRILMLHGETPSRFVDPADQATRLLFSDAGSATALEVSAGRCRPLLPAHRRQRSRRADHPRRRVSRPRARRPARPVRCGWTAPAIFNFTIKRVPPLIKDALALSRASPSTRSTRTSFTSRTASS